MYPGMIVAAIVAARLLLLVRKIVRAALHHKRKESKRAKGRGEEKRQSPSEHDPVCRSVRVETPSEKETGVYCIRPHHGSIPDGYTTSTTDTRAIEAKTDRPVTRRKVRR